MLPYIAYMDPMGIEDLEIWRCFKTGCTERTLVTWLNLPVNVHHSSRFIGPGKALSTCAFLLVKIPTKDDSYKTHHLFGYTSHENVPLIFP
jgi:hypothetical protein